MKCGTWFYNISSSDKQAYISIGCFTKRSRQNCTPTAVKKAKGDPHAVWCGWIRNALEFLPIPVILTKRTQF